MSLSPKHNYLPTSLPPADHDGFLSGLEGFSLEFGQVHHSIDQQVCCALLLTVYRLATSQLDLTHNLLASALGVTRGNVTVAATELQEARAIRCGRAMIMILDREVVEGRVCECHEVVKRECNRLLCDMPV